MSSNLFTVINSREEFNENVEANGVCVVDFFATWCGPCTSLAKSLTEEANSSNSNSEILKKATFIKVNVDQFSDLAELYNVSALPYLIFFKNGKLTEHFVRGNNKEAVITSIKLLTNV